MSVISPTYRPAVLSTALRGYAIAIFVIFLSLSLGFGAQSHLLAEHGGNMNWTIWNDVRAGDQRAHVPPMLFVIYLVWGVFLLRAARDPLRHESFLVFTMWANLAHGLLMVFQATGDLSMYWSKFFTDIPFILGLAVVVYLWGPQSGRMGTSRHSAAQHESHQ